MESHQEVMNQLAELDFSADTFWTELELLATRESRKSKDAMDPKFGRAAACWASLLVSGHPFQVLHSRPLQMAGGFLRSVLASIGAPSVNLSGNLRFIGFKLSGSWFRFVNVRNHNHLGIL